MDELFGYALVFDDSSSYTNATKVQKLYRESMCAVPLTALPAIGKYHEATSKMKLDGSLLD